MTKLKDDDPKSPLYCSFCGKSQHEVRKLIAGPSVFICDECVDLCTDIIKEENKGPLVRSPEGIPAPKQIYEVLNDYVIGQDRAKKVLSVAVHNHYKRLNHATKNNDVELGKANILLIGPTGTGKTLLCETLSRALDVPFVTANATSLAQSEYVNEEIEAILQRLIDKAEGDIGRAQRGIVFIDEIDKLKTISSQHGQARGTTGEGVQHDEITDHERLVVAVVAGRKRTRPRPPQDFLPGMPVVVYDVPAPIVGVSKVLVPDLDGVLARGRGRPDLVQEPFSGGHFPLFL